MFKKEIIWREILYQTIEKKKDIFTQKELAKQFGFSLSTVFNSLKAPRQIKAIKVSGRNFQVVNPQKLLYLWATLRRLDKDILYQTHIDNSATAEIESMVPPRAVFAAYSAYRQHFTDVPADYDKVYFYYPADDLKTIKNRFPYKKGYPNLIVLKADFFLKNYGHLTTWAQTFVDLWNLEDWYAENFTKALEEKLNI